MKKQSYPSKLKDTEPSFGNVLANGDGKQQKKQWEMMYSDRNLLFGTMPKRSASM